MRKIMKLSEKTLKIFKNFGTINQSVLIRVGSLLSTKSVAGDILAEAQIEEEFPIEFALYDVVEFLNTLKLFSSPVLDFRDADDGNFMYICEEDDLGFKVRYTFAKKERIVYPKRRPSLGNVDISFELESASLESIIKASNVMQLPNIMFVPGNDGKSVKVEVFDIKNPSANKFSISVDAMIPEGKDFKIVFKMEDLKLLPNQYSISINGVNSISMFESDTIDYCIGLDNHSKF